MITWGGSVKVQKLDYVINEWYLAKGWAVVDISTLEAWVLVITMFATMSELVLTLVIIVPPTTAVAPLVVLAGPLAWKKNSHESLTGGNELAAFPSTPGL